jgi:hypothetical protein
MLNLKSKWVKLSAGLMAGTVLLWASGIAPQAYNLIQANGSSAAKGSTLNLANNTGITWACATVGVVTTCTPTVSGGGGTGGGITVYSGPSVSLLGTQYFPIGGGASNSGTETNVDVESPAAATVSNFYVQLSAALGIGNSAVFTWRDTASPTTLTCTISGSVATSCNDTTHSFNAVQGDLLDIQVVTTGVPSAGSLVMATQFGSLGTPGYITVQNNGTPLAQEPVLNLTNGTNTTMACTDNPGVATNCQVNAGGGGGGFIQTLTAPVAASFTQLNYNVGSGVTTTQVNNTVPVTSITLKQSDPNVTENIAALAKNKVAATFTLTEAWAMGGTSNQSFCGLWLSDGGSPPKNIIMGQQIGPGWRISLFSNFTSFSGDIMGTVTAMPWLLWTRVQETVSNRIYSTSSDGITFSTAVTESNTANFTTAQYGMACEIRGGSGTSGTDIQMTLYSLTETNP